MSEACVAALRDMKDAHMREMAARMQQIADRPANSHNVCDVEGEEAVVVPKTLLKSDPLPPPAPAQQGDIKQKRKKKK